MPNLPSGMSVAEAEALSKRQQAERIANLPKEGEYFRSGATSPIQQMKGGKLVTIRPEDILGTQQVANSQGVLETQPNWGQATNAGGEWQNYFNAASKKLGIDVSGLNEYQIGDVRTALNNNVAIPYSEEAARAEEQGTVSMAGSQQQNWIDPATGQPTPIGIGVPTPINQTTSQLPAGATYISDPKELAGLTENQIWRDPNSDRIYKVQQATLTSPTGEKKVVGVGSTEANNLLKQGWSLGDGDGGDAIGSNTLQNQPEVNIGTGTIDDGGSGANNVIAGSTEYSKQKRKEIEAELALAERQDDSMDLQLEKLMGEYSSLSESAKSFETIKAEEKAKADLTAQKQELSQKMDEIDIALAKSRALDADYQAKNQLEEGRPQTLSRLQGQQAQNYKMYLAQHNSIASDVALLTAEGKAIEGNYNDSIELANEAINLRYQSQQDAINNKINMINLLIPQIDKKDKEYAAALLKIETRELAALADQKALDLYEAKKQIDQKYGSAAGSKFTTIGQDEYGNNLYGFVDEANQTVTPAGQFTDGSASGVVNDAGGNSYNILSYATDPNHEASVQQHLNRIGKMDSWEAMDAYIQQVAPNSPVTGEMIGKASEKYGVSWEAMMAIMQQDSLFGTAGAAIRSMNPGNVGNTEQATSTGQLNMMASWQEGVDVVAKNLAWRKVEGGVAGGTYDRNYEFTYNEKVDTNRLPKIGGKLITNKTARMGNLPYGITDKQADWIQLRRPGNIEFQKLKVKDYDSLIGLFELREDIGEIKNLKEGVNTGWLAAKDRRVRRFLGAGELPSFINPGKNVNEFTRLEVKTGKELANYIKSISGAAVSEQEAQRLGRNVPNVDMQDSQFLIALDDYEDDVNAIIQGKLAQYDFESEDDLRKIITGAVSGDNNLTQDELLEIDSLFNTGNTQEFNPANFF